jgi:FMN reductase
VTVLLIAGSPTSPSRSSALLEAVGQRLEGRGARIDRIAVRDLPAQPLLHADWSHPAVERVIAQVAEARVVVIATPVYKAAYSGILKVLLDLLPQDGLKGKVVLPLATGGSPNHMLALDYALRPGAAVAGRATDPAGRLRHRFAGHARQRRCARRGTTHAERTEP